MTRRNRAINFIFWNAVLCGCLYGYGWTQNITFAFLIGLLSVLMIYVGMVLAFMVSDEREEKKRLELEQNYAMMTVRMSKEMAFHVASTVVAKHVRAENGGKHLDVLNDVESMIDNESVLLSGVLSGRLSATKES